MSLLINQKCIACDACIEECPNVAIDSGDPIYIIDPELCTECIGVYGEPNCVMTCPVDAIVPDPNHIESPEELRYKQQKISSEE